MTGGFKDGVDVVLRCDIRARADPLGTWTFNWRTTAGNMPKNSELHHVTSVSFSDIPSVPS